MSSNTKAIAFSLGMFFIVFAAIYLTLLFIFKNIDPAIIGGITAFLSVLLSPRRTIIQKQTGEEVQLKWIFSKKVITFK